MGFTKRTKVSRLDEIDAKLKSRRLSGIKQMIEN